MKTENLKNLVEVAGQQARAVLLGLRQPLMPTWVYIDQEGHPHIVATPWQDDTEKKFFAAKIRLAMVLCDASAYSFVCEAWAANEKPGEAHIQPRNRADRREIVLAFATDGDQIEWKSWNIKRDWNDCVLSLEEEEPMKGRRTSWLTQLLSKK